MRMQRIVVMARLAYAAPEAAAAVWRIQQLRKELKWNCIPGGPSSLRAAAGAETSPFGLPRGSALP